MTNQKIHVLVADDSKVARMLLVHLLESDPQIQVLGAVSDGQAALEFARLHQPDVIVMDLHMPNLDGLEATRLIMESRPVPIIICTATTDPTEIVTTFRMMEAGAVACVEKPLARERPGFQQLVEELLVTVKLMSEVKVVRRWPRSRSTPTTFVRRLQWTPPPTGVTLIGVGASTGGPPVLQSILSGLTKDFPGALLIVQHVSRGFLPGMVEWLNQTSAVPVQIAENGITPQAGHAYLAPDDLQMGLSAAGRIVLSPGELENGVRPAVSHLFRSLAEARGAGAVGVLLTGMGRDGAEELKLLRDKGAATIAQDRESSIVHGMPGAAIELGAATHILAADKIAGALLALVHHKQADGEIKA